MSPDRLFLHRCAQIGELLQSREEMEMLDLAGHLRKLILDKHCLVAAANRNRLKLRFVVTDLNEDALGDLKNQALLLALGADVDGAEAFPERQLSLGLDEFIAHKVALVLGHTVTVRGLIRWAANVKGGIHFDPKPDREYFPAIAMERLMSGAGRLDVMTTIRGVGAVTFRGIQPLVRDVESRS